MSKLSHNVDTEELERLITYRDKYTDLIDRHAGLCEKFVAMKSTQLKEAQSAAETAKAYLALHTNNYNLQNDIKWLLGIFNNVSGKPRRLNDEDIAILQKLKEHYTK